MAHTSLSAAKDAKNDEFYSEVHTTEVVCFWLLKPSTHCLMRRAAGTYSPQGKPHTNPYCQKIQSKARQREKKARQTSQTNPTHEQALTSKPLAKDQLSPTTHTYFEWKMYDEHKGSSPVIAIDTSNMDAGLQTAVNLVKQQIETASR